MKINTEDLISVSEANKRGVSGLVSSAEQGRTLIVMRNNKATAAIVGVDRMDELQRAERMVEELRLLSVAITRVATDTGERQSLEDVAREFGVDLPARG